jgi:competence protein ComEA
VGFPIRFVPGWRRLALIAGPITVAIALAVGAVLYRAAAVEPPPAAAAPITDPVLAVPSDSGLLIHVIGAVESPGLYRLPRGDRVFDAIGAAGGLSADADLSRLPDLAGLLRDGEQVKVAFTKTSSGTVVVRINLNQATLEELETVPGFTPAFAADVIDYRTNFGGFQNTRELVDVLGMSEADYVIVRRYVTL